MTKTELALFLGVLAITTVAGALHVLQAPDVGQIFLMCCSFVVGRVIPTPRAWTAAVVGEKDK